MRRHGFEASARCAPPIPDVADLSAWVAQLTAFDNLAQLCDAMLSRGYVPTMRKRTIEQYALGVALERLGWRVSWL